MQKNPIKKTSMNRLVLVSEYFTIAGAVRKPKAANGDIISSYTYGMLVAN